MTSLRATFGMGLLSLLDVLLRPTPDQRDPSRPRSMADYAAASAASSASTSRGSRRDTTFETPSSPMDTP
jgi:hypothetical protein